MKQLISEFPNNFVEAAAIAEKASFSKPKNTITNIVICGMGGSGIGGTIVSKWLENDLSVPVYVVKDYNIPNFVSQNSLVIGSSYSGNTEETLAAIEGAIAKGAHVIGITSGGKMEALCKEHGFDHVIVPGGNPPRSALAYSLVQLVNVFVQLGMVPAERYAEVLKGKELILAQEENIKSEAMNLAKFLQGKVGILYGTTEYEGVLVRARQQFNENSKALCWHHMIPEMNHNELVGWGGGDERFAPVFFDTTGNHPRNDKRIQITKDRVSGKTSIHTVVSKGSSRIEQSIYIINVVDWASWYLSELKAVDAIDIEVIDFLKGELAKF